MRSSPLNASAKANRDFSFMAQAPMWWVLPLAVGKLDCNGLQEETSPCNTDPCTGGSGADCVWGKSRRAAAG